METCSRAQLTLLTLIYITLLQALQAQKIKVPPEVTGYLGHDVTLPCQFIKGAEDVNITQVQWDLLPPNEEKIMIAVSHAILGVYIDELFLGRVDISEQSLLIRDLEMADAGVYGCSIVTFPSGSFTETINLVVREQMPLSPGVVAGIVIAVMLLSVIMAATAYLIIIRMRHEGLVGNHVCIDTSGPAVDVGRPSVIATEEGLVYSDVKFKRSRHVSSSSKGKHSEGKYVDDDVTYSHVAVGRRPLKREGEIYAFVNKKMP